MTRRLQDSMSQLSKPVFVVLEGLDGCGKSTVCRLLAERLGTEVLKTPPAELDPVRGLLEDLLEHSALGRPLFYAAMASVVSDRARRNLEAGMHTVCDRYHLSTLAYATARGNLLPPWEIESHLLVPTATFFLDADAAVRRARMASRPLMNAEDWRSTKDAFEATLLQAFRFHGRRWCGKTWHVIDTNRKDPSLVADAILATLQKEGA